MNSLEQIFSQKKAKLVPEIATAMQGGTFASPELIELITWNVVVAFFVNLAASAAYPKLTSWLEVRGRLTLLDLEAAQDEIKQPVVSSAHEQPAAARARLLDILAEYGLLEEQRALLATRLTEILLAHDEPR